MYILKNAWKTITRNKSRNILIGIIILVISCSSAVTLAIRNSANKLIDSYASKYETIATIGVNRENLMKNMQPGDDTSKDEMKENFEKIENITVENIKKYADSKYVSSYYYTSSVGLNSDTLEVATSDTSRGGKRGGLNNQESQTEFTLTGYSSYEAMTEFVEGTYTITSGEVSSDFDSNNCIINEELATLNDITVGDEIILVNPNDTGKKYTLKVTGIYKESNEGVPSRDRMSMFSNSVNTIITNVNEVVSIGEGDDSLTIQNSPSFVLTSSDVVDKFSNELTDKGLSEYLSVSTNLDEVEKATSTISNVVTFATTFLVITLIIGGVVLFVLNMINVRERKYEIGVLRTIGMKKTTLTCQFMIELLIVTIIGLSLGAGIGACISMPVSNKLLESEIESSQNEQKEIRNNFGSENISEPPENDSQKSSKDNKVFDVSKVSGVNNVEKFTSIDAVVDVKVLVQLLLIGIGLTIISGFAAMISIQRFSPLTILKERS